MLSVKNIFKSYGKVRALNGFSFEASSGEVIGIIGPNGAGKTTLFRIIVGLLKDYSGIVRIFNQIPSFKIFEFISYLPEEPKFREEFTVDDLFRVHSLLYKLKKEEVKNVKSELIELFDLGLYLKRPLSSLSKGTKRRAYFMASLANINKSHLLILDEPFDGIDPETRVRIRDYLKSQKNKIIIFSSHTLFDVEKIATRVIFIKNGENYKELKEIKTATLEDEFMKMVKDE
ncbi:MAG: ABC transporter ATP-binding protein [candidate division WOR-3 bacterium]